jgi:hypothetical protein
LIAAPALATDPPSSHNDYYRREQTLTARLLRSTFVPHMSAADPRVAMLAEMREPAFRLGMAFAAEAERACDMARKIEFFHLFDRCGFAVRVGIALELRLERTPAARAAPREPASDREDLRDRETLAERDEADDDRGLRYEPEYERERETERASFPILIRALEGVVAEAAELPGPPPAELITLRELLAKAKAAPPAPRAPGPRLKACPGGVETAVGPPPRRPASNVAEVLAARRATGPPRR